MKFSELGLSEKVLKAVEASGYDTPTPIKNKPFPTRSKAVMFWALPRPAPARRPPSCCRCCQSLERGRARVPRTLVLVPTRELAAQVDEAFGKILTYHEAAPSALIGGVSLGDQESKTCARRRASSSPPPAACSTHLSRGSITLDTRSRSSSSTRPTGCSTWASIPTSSASSQALPRRARRCSSRRPCRRKSRSSGCVPSGSRSTSRLPRGDDRREHRPDPRSLGRIAGSRSAATLRGIIRGAENFKNVHHLLQPQTRRASGRTASCRSTASTSRRCTATSNSRCGSGDRGLPRRPVHLLVCTDVAAGLDIPT